MRRTVRPQTRQTRTSMAVLRLVFVLPVVASLLAGVAGGLLRAGVSIPSVLSSSWMSPAVAAHAFLMICTFMGTLIGIERAVAVKHPLSFVAPLASGAGGLALLCGAIAAAEWLVAGASVAFIAVNIVVVRRQRAAHTYLLLVGALAWATGSLLHALGVHAAAVVPWWFSFLVLTIAAERLEMTRLMRRREGASHALYAIFGGLLLGAALSALTPVWGGVLYGLSLVALSGWLITFDVARRTVHAHGLSRYMAICLLLGYFWLLVAGLAWTATSLGLPLRDAALHALGLGFVFSMMLGHAPVILPAITRVKVLFGWAHYLPLAVLHGSLAVRLVGSHLDHRALAEGAAGNAVAIALFLATMAASAIAWRTKYSQPRSKSDHGTAAEH